MIGIYLIINTIDGKLYIGSSSNIEHRCQVHISLLNKNSHKNSYLQNAWNKYGADAFHFCIVEECSIDNLIAIEQLWIDASKYNCYNLSEIADRYKVSEFAKVKISVALKGRRLSDAHRANLKLAHKRNKGKYDLASRLPNWTGKKHTDATKQKISESRLKALDKNLNLQSYTLNSLFVGL